MKHVLDAHKHTFKSSISYTISMLNVLPNILIYTN